MAKLLLKHQTQNNAMNRSRGSRAILQLTINARDSVIAVVMLLNLNASMSHRSIILASLLIACGCGQPDVPMNENPTLIDEIAVHGFDHDGEPVIKRWSDGTLWIHFEAMPPFFAEDDGTEQDFEHFETKLQDALRVTVRRDDREVFVIDRPNPDTAEKAKAWLEAYRNNGA